ncbi:MAG: UDP-N-acetylmuramoyl-tripeptide--D-alanyl-D-alanine ligase [Syntrophomonadaceae bacterium]|nr:UDP-N-acetylmuramoyl-tripeptide--D-alanyl-D-alanine ligase [Syntrophomonadaceae bacterium]
MNNTLGIIAEVIGAKMPSEYANIIINDVVTDSRKVASGSLFFALSGEKQDGHDFVEESISLGAAGAVISRPMTKGPFLLVEDTEVALHKMAAYHRSQYNIPVIAVTGSVGKTTTKDLLAHLLQGDFNTLKTAKNYNNQIGLPLTLFGLNDTHQACVVEMAMRAPGEISLLSQISRPDGCIIVNVAPVHMETMGTIENIARAKLEVLNYTRDFAVLNKDNQELCHAARDFSGLIYWFGYGADCDWRIIDVRSGTTQTVVEMDLKGLPLQVALSFPAIHLAENVVAAVGTAILLGVQPEKIKDRISNFQISAGRLTILKGINGSTIIDDTYNANPRSMKAALQVLVDLAGERRKIAVLGGMFELGNYELEGHYEVGQRAAALGIESLITVGELAGNILTGARAANFGGEMRRFETKSEAITFLVKTIKANDVVLIKASRGLFMEEIVQVLSKEDVS